MAAVVERDLGTGDRPHTQRLQRLRHLHCAVQAVVIGQRKSAVPLGGGRSRKFDRMGRPVQKRVGGMTVQLDVRHEHMFAADSDGGCAGLSPDDRKRRNASNSAD